MKYSQLVVKNVDSDIVSALRERAASNNRSMEAEHRDILERALRGTKRISLAEALMKIPTVDCEDDFLHRSDS